MKLRRAGLIASVLAALAATACASSGVAPAAPFAAVVSRARNPVLPGADPHITVAAGRYWLSTTTPGSLGRGRWQRLYAYQSDDLRTWTRTAPIFSFDGVDWIDDDGVDNHGLWAPALAEANGRFYLYYSVGPQNPTPSRLGVAVSDSPTGPFVDSGRPLLTGGDGFEAIDPMVFVDPRSGTAHLYVGGSAGATLRVFELAADMVSLRREIPIQQPPNFTEGPFVHERNGVYYLSYSHGRWYDSSYSAHYATAPSPVGPWTYRGPILTSSGRFKGPGHHSIVQNPATGAWFIAYHHWESTRDRDFEGERQVAVQALTHRADGTIEPLRISSEPPPLSPLTRAQSAISRRSSLLRMPASITSMTAIPSSGGTGLAPAPVSAATMAR